MSDRTSNRGLMTGPAHYAAGDRLLASITTRDGRGVLREGDHTMVLALAQAHYTAALAAATALMTANDNAPGFDFNAWDEVAGVRRVRFAASVHRDTHIDPCADEAAARRFEHALLYMGNRDAVVVTRINDGAHRSEWEVVQTSGDEA